jgi:cob(I)alamin adenosyltransferase
MSTTTVNGELYRKCDIFIHALGALEELRAHVRNSPITRNGSIYVLRCLQTQLRLVHSYLCGEWRQLQLENLIKELEKELEIPAERYVFNEDTCTSSQYLLAAAVCHRVERHLVATATLGPSASESTKRASQMAPYFNRLYHVLLWCGQ